ncbi:MAG: N-acetylglucosamine-6-phosphate deacetylase [Olsenella sp.]|nr:N-acetylglucosamine-6-phosphate deacetylase [Olsenella sp.]
MSTYALKADRFVLPGSVACKGYLTIEEGTFGTWSAGKPDGIEVRDFSGAWIAPGYVDTHVHGFLGHDVMDCDADGVNEASLGLARHGTTSWLPTTLTQPAEQIEAACASVWEASEGRGDDFCGARIEGIFLEGPFFTEKHKGAQNPANMLDPSVELFCQWQEAAHGLICKSSLAPERAGAADYCRDLKAMGVVTALGHSSATCAQGLAAVAAGATAFVHTYNAMEGLHHREPGLVGCAMTTRNTYSELICDGHHVSPVAVQALVAAKGWDHVAVISDCLRCGGMPDGDYVLGDLPIRLVGETARLIGEDGLLGNLAGAATTVATGVKNLANWGVVTPEQAIRMGSEVPALSAGVDDVCGSMLPGRSADFNVLNADLTVAETYISGMRVE